MGSSRPRNSTRAVKARSVNSPHKPRRKPDRPKSSALRMARGTSRERRAEAILKAAKATEPARAAGADALRREHDLLRPAAGALREIRQQLDLACSCAIVVAHALTEQNVELDDDAALVLRRHVSDPLYKQVLRIDRLLGDRPDDDDQGKEDHS
jgi:hypothetical protein